MLHLFIWQMHKLTFLIPHTSDRNVQTPYCRQIRCIAPFPLQKTCHLLTVAPPQCATVLPVTSEA
jgi:hypothetical protein